MNFHNVSTTDLTRRITSLFAGSKKWRGWMETLPQQAPHEYHAPMVTKQALSQLVQKTNAHDIECKIRDNTARQLALSLGMRIGDTRTQVILDSLVHLVEANEISFSAYVNKLDHLYPDAMKSLDINLRARVTSLLNHTH
ncbi:MAG: hypothetical protein ACOYJ2_00720 [Rickettsiales bacterium]